jgi:hypothetical protein
MLKEGVTSLLVSTFSTIFEVEVGGAERVGLGTGEEMVTGEVVDLGILVSGEVTGVLDLTSTAGDIGGEGTLLGVTAEGGLDATLSQKYYGTHKL